MQRVIVNIFSKYNGVHKSSVFLVAFCTNETKPEPHHSIRSNNYKNKNKEKKKEKDQCIHGITIPSHTIQSILRGS
jgi:hypothetical protein